MFITERKSAIHRSLRFFFYGSWNGKLSIWNTVNTVVLDNHCWGPLSTCGVFSDAVTDTACGYLLLSAFSICFIFTGHYLLYVSHSLSPSPQSLWRRLVFFHLQLICMNTSWHKCPYWPHKCPYWPHKWPHVCNNPKLLYLVPRAFCVNKIHSWDTNVKKFPE